MTQFSINNVKFNIPESILNQYIEVELLGWQKAVKAMLDLRIENPEVKTIANMQDHIREFNTIYVNMPRRSGKTTLIIELAKQYPEAIIVLGCIKQKHLYPKFLHSRIFEYDSINSYSDLVLIDEPKRLPITNLPIKSNRTIIFSVGTL
jgi:predicted AAA+ superfamily ATPase